MGKQINYWLGYEELLIDSIKKHPTPHNIWMLHRCYNDLDDKNHETHLEIIKSIKNDTSISEELKQVIDELAWE